MKVLLDANIAIDILGETDDLFYSLQAVDIALLRDFDPVVAASTLPTVTYVLASQNYASRADALEGLESFTNCVGVLDVTEADYRRAIKEPGRDFEDTMLSWCAYRNGVGLIITRNLRDFKDSPVAAVTPQRFCETYRPKNYIYDQIQL